jgi:N-acetylmuramoyl-L-alanine amidase CwlA
MRIDRSFISNQNTYEENDPRCIVVHNTDNFRAGADARTHAEAQHNGELSNMSAHYYVDDGETAYQAAPHSRGCWHVGVNYGGTNLFGKYGNRSSIGVEMCVPQGYDQYSEIGRASCRERV